MNLLTYEELRKIERAERDSKALTSLPKDLINRYNSYVLDKKQALSADDDNLIAKKVMERASKELANAELSFKTLFELRLKKIIEQAFIDLRMGAKPVIDNMLPEEQSFYEGIRSMIELHQTSIIRVKGKLKKSKLNLENNKEKSDQFILVRFIRSVPVFAWDNKEFGPYKMEDVANLPKELVKVLLKQESIKIMG